MLNKFNVYNKEIKEGFLNYYSKNKDTLTSLIYTFQRGEPLEKQLDKEPVDYKKEVQVKRF